MNRHYWQLTHSQRQQVNAQFSASTRPPWEYTYEIGRTGNVLSRQSLAGRVAASSDGDIYWRPDHAQPTPR